MFGMQVNAIPTYCGERRKRKRIGSSKRTIKRKSTFIRTIFGIPHQKVQFIQSHTFDGGVVLRILRGKNRTELLAQGLCAKLEASPTWTDDKIRKMSELFLDRIQPSSDNTYKFSFLTVISGLKLLQNAKINSSFVWSGNALQHLGRSTIYISAHDQHRLKCFPVEQLNCDQNSGSDDDGANTEEPNASKFRLASNNEEVRRNGN